MEIALLRGENLRTYSSGFEIRPHPRLNLIVGPNAAGKTTLLEGLYVLGRARSFRAAEPGELAGIAGRYWRLHGRLQRPELEVRIGAGWGESGMEIRIDGQAGKTSVLARTLPLQLIDPGGHRLVEDSPGYRRSYLDWGVFHVEPSFLRNWQRYQRALQQRNLALRQGLSDAAVSAWNAELVSMAEAVTVQRVRHIAALEPRLHDTVLRLLGVEDARCEFHRGWPAQIDYGDLLRDQLGQHRRLVTTAHGPHRAELKLWLGPQRAKGRVSRGQQKLLVACLVLAQCMTLIEAGVPAPIILVDDFGAELSNDYQQRLANALAGYPGQIFISAFEIPPAFGNADKTTFHVEQGRVSKVTGSMSRDQ